MVVRKNKFFFEISCEVTAHKMLERLATGFDFRRVKNNSEVENLKGQG